MRRFGARNRYFLHPSLFLQAEKGSATPNVWRSALTSAALAHFSPRLAHRREHPIEHMMRSAHLLVLLAASVAASRRLAISSVGSLRGGGGDDPLSEAKAKWSGWLGDAKAKAASMGAPKAATDPALTQALSLIKKRTLVNCEKAVGLLRGAHTRDPANDDVKLELADALNAVSQPASQLATAALLAGST